MIQQSTTRLFDQLFSYPEKFDVNKNLTVFECTRFTDFIERALPEWRAEALNISPLYNEIFIERVYDKVCGVPVRCGVLMKWEKRDSKGWRLFIKSFSRPWAISDKNSPVKAVNLVSRFKEYIANLDDFNSKYIQQEVGHWLNDDTTLNAERMERLLSTYSPDDRLTATLDTDEHGLIVDMKIAHADTQFPDEDTLSYQAFLFPFLMAVSYLHDKKNLETVSPSRQERRAAERSGTSDLLPSTYHVLRVPNFEKYLNQSRGGSLGKVRFHSVIGNWAFYSPENPHVSGKIGQIYREPHTRGNPKRGTVKKDYQIDPSRKEVASTSLA